METITKSIATKRLENLHAWASHMATDVIFPWWTSDFIMDKEYGGFYGRITLDLQIDNEEPRALVLTGRMLYAFSAAYLTFKNPLYLERAKYTFEYMMDKFYDKEYGGAYTYVSKEGVPEGTDKPNYCEAFLLMGAAQYYHASGDPEAKRVAFETFDLMESKVKWGPSSYYGNMTRDWKPAKGMGFGRRRNNPPAGENNANAPKPPAFPPMPEGAVSFPHHLCQAYVRLYEATGDERVKAALKEMVEFLAYRAFDEEHKCIASTVGPDNKRIGTRQSFGHDCEISYLSMRAARLVGDEKLYEDMKNVIIQVCTQVRDHDFDPWHSLYNGGDLTNDVRDPVHVWWAQAEAVSSMLCGYSLTGDESFLDACEAQADYLNKYFVNHEHGDWYNNIVVDEEGWHVTNGGHGFDKLNGGKCPFHNSQMCFEVMDVTERLLKA